jgi:hypothetical protein
LRRLSRPDRSYSPVKGSDLALLGHSRGGYPGSQSDHSGIPLYSTNSLSFLLKVFISLNLNSKINVIASLNELNPRWEYQVLSISYVS